jgi:pterin-4a-carbinolamine dehydratase
MLRARGIPRLLVGGSRQAFQRDLKTIRLALVPPYTPSPWLSALPRRSLHLAAQDAVTISDDRTTVRIRLENGEVITQTIQPTPKASLAKLSSGLAEIFSHGPRWTHQRPGVVDTTNCGLHPNKATFASSEWQLDPKGDAIHRHLAMPLKELTAVNTLIDWTAEQMNHHPHISIKEPTRDQQNYFMTVTCTTHSPRGLSLKDITLAKKINQVLLDHGESYGMSYESPSPNPVLQNMLDQCRRSLIVENQVKIDEALKDCGCADAKAT